MKVQNRTREEIKKEFEDVLKENTGLWKRGWILNQPERNTSKQYYQGINRFYLSMVSKMNGFSDNRWFTYNQIKYDKNLELIKGAKGVHVEYWYFEMVKRNQESDQEFLKRVKEANKVIKRPIYNTKKELNVDFKIDQVKDICKSKLFDEEKDFTMRFKNYVVFNGDFVKGLNQKQRENIPKDNKFKIAELIAENYLKNENIKFYEGGNGSFYKVMDDSITLPEKEYFNNEEEYISTLLHEICHSTGAKERLNRNLNNLNDDKKLAIEELKAEISATMLCAELEVEMSQEHIDNHKAYVKDWLENIEGQKGEYILMKAIKDAEDIVDYVKDKGDYNYVVNKVLGKGNIQDKEIAFAKATSDSLQSIVDRLKDVVDKTINADSLSLNKNDVDIIFKDQNNENVFISFDSNDYQTAFEGKEDAEKEGWLTYLNNSINEAVMPKLQSEQYKLIYMNSKTHLKMWQLINKENLQSSKYNGAIMKYAQFCKENNITKKYLETMNRRTLDADIFKLKEEKAYNRKSVLECESYYDQKQHIKENDKFFDMLNKYKDKDAIIKPKYLDPYNYNRKVDIENCKVGDVENFIIYNSDFKNGIDISLSRDIDSNKFNIDVKVYGQTYTDKRTNKIYTVTENFNVEIVDDNTNLEKSNVIENLFEKSESKSKSSGFSK